MVLLILWAPSVIEVLPLEIDGGADPGREVGRGAEGRRAAHVVPEQVVEFGGEGRVAQGSVQGLIQLVQGRDERLGNVPAAKNAEAIVLGEGGHGIGEDGEDAMTEAVRTASANARMRS